MAHRVDISKTQELAFPDRCVNCGAGSPGATMNIKGALSNWKPVHEDIFKSWRADVPCCPGCQGRVRRDRFVAKILYGVAFVAGVFLLLIVLALWPAITESWLIYVAILGCMAIPVAVVQSLHVPQIELTPSHDRLVFEFKNLDFANQFAELNQSKVR